MLIRNRFAIFVPVRIVVMDMYAPIDVGAIGVAVWDVEPRLDHSTRPPCAIFVLDFNAGADRKCIMENFGRKRWIVNRSGRGG